VGVDREAKILGISLDKYVQRIVASFQNSNLTDPLRTQVLAGFDTITVHGLTVVRVLIPKQRAMSFVGQRAFCRQGSTTVEVTGQEVLAISKRFPT
jgi:hypothetical protein